MSGSQFEGPSIRLWWVDLVAAMRALDGMRGREAEEVNAYVLPTFSLLSTLECQPIDDALLYLGQAFPLPLTKCQNSLTGLPRALFPRGFQTLLSGQPMLTIANISVKYLT